MLTLHLEYGGRSTRVGLLGLPPAAVKPTLVNRSSEGEVRTRRLLSGTRKQLKDVTFEALLNGDPELDLSVAGIELDQDSVSAAYFDPAAERPEAIGDFQDIDIVYDSQGNEKARRPHRKLKCNLDELHPVKITKRLPLAEVLTGFAFKSSLQVGHVDGLTFDFLHALAKDLQDKQEAAVLGAGAKGNMPLVLRESGSPYRAFLVGEVEGAERYRLLMLISDQELKMPEPKA
jgi:hypothetical protein